jgi:transposase
MITANVQVWVATTPVDMRKSFDALAEVVRAFLGRDPHSGSLFVFRNKSGHLVKILWWESTGWTLYYRRLEQGVFHFPTDGTTAVEIPHTELLKLLSGARVTPLKKV